MAGRVENKTLEEYENENYFFLRWSDKRHFPYTSNRPFFKMAAENLNKSKLKTNTSAIKSTLTLVTLPSFSISGEITAEKMLVENCKIYRRLYDWGYNTYPKSYKGL